MVEKFVSPQELRLAQASIIVGIKERTLKPSSIVELLDGEGDEEARNAMRMAFNKHAPDEFKERVQIVRAALRDLEKFDRP